MAVRFLGLLLVVVSIQVGCAEMRWVMLRLIALIMVDMKLIDLDNVGLLRLEVDIAVCT